MKDGSHIPLKYSNPECSSLIHRNPKALRNSPGLGFTLKRESLKYWRGYIFIHAKPSMLIRWRSRPNAVKVSVSRIGDHSRILTDNLWGPIWESEYFWSKKILLEMFFFTDIFNRLKQVTETFLWNPLNPLEGKIKQRLRLLSKTWETGIKIFRQKI